MNVLHFINNLNREGAQVMVSNLVTATQNSEISYSVCLRQPGGSLVAELREKGLKVFEPSRYFGFRSLRQSVTFLKNTCKNNQIHVIHAHMADAAFLGWLVARKLNLPLVISHHGHDILLKCNPVCRLVYYVLLNLAAAYASMNIAVSESVADRVRRLLWIKADRLQVISNGVRLPDGSLLGDRRVRTGVQQEPLMLISVGRLVALKDQRQLILAVAGLINYFPDICLYIVGGGEMEGELKRLARDKKVEHCVEFTGPVDDVAPYLARADIYLSSSQSEGMPVSVLEAMAWGLPVIASDIPGNRSVVKTGETGFLYELNNTDDLVRTIIQVATNVEQAHSVAERARSMAERQYSSLVAEQKHARMYQTILEQE